MLIFTLDEVYRLKIIQGVIDRRLTTRTAAQRLGISDRQCRRLLARYRENGPLGMTSRRPGKSSNNQLPQGLAVYALNIIERYNDFGPTLACEKLSEVHGVHLSKETVRKLMTQASLWVPRKMGIKSSGLMAYPFSIPHMTSFLKSTRLPLWTTNVLGGHWKWRSWYRSNLCRWGDPARQAGVLPAAY